MRITWFRPGKADVFELTEGNSLGCVWQVLKTPPGSDGSGACIQRGSLGTCGIRSELEDKLVQKSAEMLLSAVYGQDFYGFSLGFTEGKSAHQGLKELRDCCRLLNIGWIVDADISGFFDNIDRSLLRRFIKERVNDGGLLRPIGKRLNVAILDGDVLTYSDRGTPPTPQGSVISPVLANIFLHHVVDKWFVEEVRPRMRGRCFIVTFADDLSLALSEKVMPEG